MAVLRIQANYDAVSDNTTKTAGAETLKVGLDGSTIYRATARFDVTDLPASCDISRVEVELTVRAVGEVTGKWDIRPYHTNGTGDPEADSAANLYSRAVSQTPYCNDSFLFRYGGRHRILLGLGVGATACSDVETAAAAAGNIFSLGLAEQGDDDDYCELEALDYADSDNPLELIITYNETSTLQSLLQELAHRMDETRYETGILTTSSATVPADTAMNQIDGYWNKSWLLLLAGTYIGESRKVQSFVSSTGVFTLEKAFTGATGAVAYCMMPANPPLMARAINAAVAEGFPSFLYLPMAQEQGVKASRHHIYDVPSGMDFVDRVEYRYGGDDQEWHLAAFERYDETRVQITDGKVPTSGIIVRISGRQRLTQLDETDALTLTGTTEITLPDAGPPLIAEWLLTVAEENIRKWTRPEAVPSPSVGTAEGSIGPGMSRTDRLALLHAYRLSLEARMGATAPRQRHPVRNPMP